MITNETQCTLNLLYIGDRPIITNDALMYAVYVTDGSSETCNACGYLLMFISWIVIVFTFPLSLCFCLKVKSTAGFSHISIQ